MYSVCSLYFFETLFSLNKTRVQTIFHTGNEDVLKVTCASKHKLYKTNYHFHFQVCMGKVKTKGGGGWGTMLPTRAYR